jgi:uncharacterized protein
MDYLKPDGLVELAFTKMPYGKYQGRLLVDIPEAYYVWFEKKGFPDDDMGIKMRAMFEIKVNGLEYLLHPILGRQQ